MSVRISTVQLGGCSGCHVSILDVGADLFSDGIAVVHSYLLLDDVTSTIDAESDVLVMEGAILTNLDESLVRRMTKRAKTVVAVGSCACFGGIACLGNLTTPFRPSQHEQADDSPHALHPMVCSPKAFAHVDYFIPGCPPPPRLIGAALFAIAEGRPVPAITHTVCDECERQRTGTPPPIAPGADWKNELDLAPDETKCLLEQGYLCLGRQTIGGCEASCIKANMPCEGCRGPLLQHSGFLQFSDEQRREMLRCLR